MGKLVVTIGVGDQQGRQFEDLEVTVDTGSTFTAVPRALLQRLGVPVRRSARSRLADGSSVPVDIGWTVVRLEDQTFATQVTFAEENQPSLLGVVTLEDALLAVDPVGQRLVPVEAERLCPETTDCNAARAICTDDERKLSHTTSVRVAGPPAISVSDATVQEA